MWTIGLTRNQRHLVYALFLLIFSVLFATVILPSVKKSAMKHKLALKEGWQMRYVWGTPFAMEFVVYLFNVTNPSEVHNGVKPKLQEIGPYVYTEYTERSLPEDNPENDTVSFNSRSFFYFNSEKSAPLTGEEEFIIPNIFAVSVMNFVMRERPSLTDLAGTALDTILGNPENIFEKHKARNILFDGMPLDCTVNTMPGLAVCHEVKMKSKKYGLAVVEENKYAFSFFGSRNGTESPRKSVYRGLKKLSKISEVESINGKSNFSVWNDNYCDTFRGSDGTLFHPFLNQKGKDKLEFVYPLLCRSFTLLSDGFSKWNGVKTIRYTTDLGTDGRNVAKERCYCVDPKNPDTCLKKGAFDAFKCMQVSATFSNPHFYLADESYLSQVEGLKPEKEKHMLYLDVDPFTGIPLNTHIRTQFNIPIQKVDKFDLLKDFWTGQLPIFWMDQVIEIPDFLTDEIKGFHLGFTIGLVVQYVLMAIALGLSGYAAFKVFREHKKNKTELIPTIPLSRVNSGDKQFRTNNNTTTSAALPTVPPSALPTGVD